MVARVKELSKLQGAWVENLLSNNYSNEQGKQEGKDDSKED